MKAIVYAAKSTEDKHGSIPTQLEQCRQRAQAEGWPVVGEFSDEAFSAYHGNRGDGLVQAMALCEEAGGDVVLIVQHSDRLARGNAKEARHLVEYALWAIKREVRLVSLQDPEMLAQGDYGLLMSVVGGIRNHEDSKRKSNSVKNGINTRRALGKPWGEPPQGYIVEHKVVDGEHNTGRAIDPDAVPIIEALFAELDTGATTGEVARKLNRAGYRTKRGQPFTARRVRAMAENDDYKGAGPYPPIIDPELWDGVNEKIRRADPASVSHGRGGREPKADFPLRRLAFCSECGEPVYSIVHHGKRLYRCKASLRYTGCCEAPPIPADLVEEHVLNHLELFLGEDLETWIGERMAERSGERTALEKAVDAQRRDLERLDAQREKRMAELVEVGITPLGLEVIERIDQERESRRRDLEDAEAQLAEWTAKINADGVLDWYTRIRDLVRGRIMKADGVAEINAALHDSLMGVWLAYDGETLTADVRMRPSGLPEYDLLVAELFGSMPSREESIDLLQHILAEEQLADREATSRRRSQSPSPTFPESTWRARSMRSARTSHGAGPATRSSPSSR